MNDGKKLVDDIAIVILSCDKFKITWNPCIDHFFDAWPDCPYPIYLLNNVIPSHDDRVTDLLIGADLNWSDSLKKGLLKIEKKRVFFVYDDGFITRINLDELKSIFTIAVQNDLDSVVLRKRVIDSGKRFYEKIYKINPTAKYRNSLFLNLIKKDVLLSMLRSGENAWQFEKDGNERSINFNFYAVSSINIVLYYHGIVKGKWLPKTKKYLEKKGYNFEGSPMQSYSSLDSFGIALYSMVFVILHRIINFKL